MTDLEAAFLHHFRIVAGQELGHELAHEVRFLPGRKWRFDFAHLPSRVAVELEGGVYTNGRHTRGKGFEADATKYNAAASEGWVVFRLTAGMLDADPLGHLEPIVATIKRRDGRWKVTLTMIEDAWR